MIDKETFLKARLPERTVDLPGVGEIRVRGLSRAEAGLLRTFGENVDGAEVFVLAAGLVAPDLTEDEVRQWLTVVPAEEVETVSAAILGLSGLTGNPVGEAERSFPAGCDEADGVPRGQDPGNDGGPPPG